MHCIVTMSSKVTLSKIIRNILSIKSDYCCLCFNSISETEISYNILDEIALGDIKRTEIMNDIISDVLGINVLDSMTENDAICQKCVQVIITSYKFIQQCRYNIKQLYRVAKSLLKHTQEINEVDHDFKSVFIAMDPHNSNIELYYDKYRNSSDPTLLQKRFQILLNDAQTQNLYIDFELQPKCNNSKKSKTRTNRKAILLEDIIVNRDDQNNLKCKFCLKIFPSTLKIKQHYLYVHAPKKFQCTKCPRSFTTVYYLNRHTKVSHSDFYCSFCGKHFHSSHSLRYHEQSHVSHLICKTCGKMYKQKKSYIHHIKNEMCEKLRKSNTESIFECDYCGKKYSKKHNVATHIRIAHENGKAFSCNMCSKTFAFKSNLQAHIIKHTKQKNHQCTECGKKFVSKTTLLVHTRTHTGEKPYKCEYCVMSFLSTSRRCDHVKRHHTETNMECDICHRRFIGSKSLNIHRKLHFDIRSKFYIKKDKLFIGDK